MATRALILSSLASVTLFACGGCRSAQQEAPAPTPTPRACQLVEEGFGPRGTVPVRAEIVVDGLIVPWSLDFLPDGDILVTERPGRIRLIENGQLLPTPVAEIPVFDQGEAGLLGLALHPEFASNRLFFIYFTTERNGGLENRIERWRLSEDHRSAQPEKVILAGIPAAPIHDGGRIRIGPDGMLYASVGDATQPQLSQEPSALNGKILRLTPEGEVPPDNPFPGNPVWMLGVRNSQGFAWAGPDTMQMVDHGPSGEFGRTGHDEINVGGRGDNFGWPPIYGCQMQEGMVAPSLTWDLAVPPGGAAIYTGTEIAPWRGNLLVGTLGSEHLHRVVFGEDGRTVTLHEVYFLGDQPEGYGRLREVVMGPDGHLWVTTSNCDGRGTCPPDGDKILRIRSQ